jgi:hypothetical protein
MNHGQTTREGSKLLGDLVIGRPMAAKACMGPLSHSQDSLCSGMDRDAVLDETIQKCRG